MSSERCRVVLASPPDCMNIRKVRAFAMCSAWRKMDEKRIPFRQAIREGWQDVKKVCAT